MKLTYSLKHAKGSVKKTGQASKMPYNSLLVSFIGSPLLIIESETRVLNFSTKNEYFKIYKVDYFGDTYNLLPPGSVACFTQTLTE